MTTTEIRTRIGKLRQITRGRGATAAEEQAANKAIVRLQGRLNSRSGDGREGESLADYMIREMEAHLKLRGLPTDRFRKAAERRRDTFERGPWSPYEEAIKRKWEEGRSYSADLLGTRRQQEQAEWERRQAVPNGIGRALLAMFALVCFLMFSSGFAASLAVISNAAFVARFIRTIRRKLKA